MRQIIEVYILKVSQWKYYFSCIRVIYIQWHRQVFSIGTVTAYKMQPNTVL